MLKIQRASIAIYSRDGAGSGRSPRYRINKWELRDNLFLLGAILWVFNLLVSTLSGLFRNH
jgi:energy-coupling factor transporter transmembrane protein EcfT